ncbi:MAG: ATP-binding protein [Ramlibacter sp.]|nr:ATP-binding protein [Ramlibacter sp.]
MRNLSTEGRTCAQHGPYRAQEYLAGRWTNCPQCCQEAQLRQRAEAERQLAEKRRQEYLRDSGITGRYVEATFDSFAVATKEQQAALEVCRAFTGPAFHADQGNGLWLIGPPGTGKSHLGAAMVGDVINRHTKRAYIASARQIVRRLRATWRRDASENEEEVLEAFGLPALLVLDEVGLGFGTEGEQIQLLDVIDLRYTLKRPTVLLSNLNAPLLRTALGDRAFDRLREGARTIVCNWPSHRGARLSTE